jgi:hypothetical protein
MIDIAVVGLGAWGLCVLERTIDTARRCGTATRIHAIEPGRLGGIAYNPEQPDYLVLNNTCGQLSLYATADDAVTPGYGLSLFEWVRQRGYAWVDGECVIGVGGIPIAAGDYLPRRLMGEYLAWFYETLLAELPPLVEVVRYRTAATDIVAEAGDRERVVLDDGRSIQVNHVVLTSGHTPNRPSDPAPGEVVCRSPYPVEVLDSSPAPGEEIALSGAGQVAYDVIAALTTGRGGRFLDARSRKVYQPSGREPVIYLYSRSGVPYCAKSVTGIDPTGEYRPVVCTPEVFAAIRGSGAGRLGRRPVDLRSELLPLLFTEMRASYYVQAARNAYGPEGAERVWETLRRAWLANTFDQAASKLAVRHGTFDPEAHLFAGEQQHYTSAEEYQKHFCAMLEEDLDEALMPSGSPVKAAELVLRILRDDIRSVVEFGGLSLESYIDFKEHIKGRINRLEAGPPAMRSQQLLALIDAGIVKVTFGPDPIVRTDDQGRAVFTSTHLDIGHTKTLPSVICGHLDMPSLGRSASPLLSRLYRMGRLTQLQYGDVAVGSVAISEDFHPYDIEGRVQRNISVFGVLTEGSRYFTHYIPSPKSRIRAVLDAQACVTEILNAD